MSYDLCLFKPQPGVDPVDHAQALLEDADLDEGPSDSELEARKEALAKTFIAITPALERLVFDFEEIADEDGISLEDAKARYRHIELDAPEDGSGSQITIYDEWCSVTLPYWHEGEPARKAVAEIWQYLKAANKTEGYLAYDPQLERVLELDEDQEAMLERYEAVSKDVGETGDGD